jgi:hypothetical protein
MLPAIYIVEHNSMPVAEGATLYVLPSKSYWASFFEQRAIR